MNISYEAGDVKLTDKGLFCERDVRVTEQPSPFCQTPNTCFQFGDFLIKLLLEAQENVSPPHHGEDVPELESY